MKRVLFVDDDPNVLAALRASLRRQRREWKMTFLPAGQAAVEALAAEPFDVIVTDLRMPDVDGAEVLRAARESCPDAARLLLTGSTEMQHAGKAVGLAHQLLSKPCDGEMLRKAIDRACELKGRLGSDALRRAVGGLDTVPSSPRVYQELERALAAGEGSIEQVAKIIESDVGLTAKILQLVNSAFFGARQPIRNTRKAVSFLGTNLIHQLVLSVEAGRAFDRKHRVPGFSLDDEQRHAILASSIIRQICPDPQLLDDAIMAGILHDLGNLVLATSIPDEFGAAIAGASERGVALPIVEQELYGCTHAEIGAHLLGLWGLPTAVVDAVAFHHRPAEAPQEGLGLAGLVHITEGLLGELEDGCGPHHDSLDIEYVHSVGMADRMEQWRAIAAAAVGRGAEG